jgi:hypothetical protein
MLTSLANGINIAVKVDGKELIFSGLIHINRTYAEVEFDNLCVGFNFIQSNGSEARYESRIEGNKLILDLYNHHNSLGEGVYDPIEIGRFRARRLYLTYYVSTPQVEEVKRRLEFAFYIGEAV